MIIIPIAYRRVNKKNTRMNHINLNNKRQGEYKENIIDTRRVRKESILLFEKGLRLVKRR